MFPNIKSSAIFFSLLCSLISADAMYRVGHRSRLSRRRMGQEARVPLDIPGCPGQICGMNAAAPTCCAQDLADQTITQAKTDPLITDDKVRQALIEWAKKLAGAEKNTHPIYYPFTLRNHLYCQKVPVNKELEGIVAAQDPANGPELFFDPKVPGGTVKLGERPDTRPRGSSSSDEKSSSTATNTTASISVVNATTTPESQTPTSEPKNTEIKKDTETLNEKKEKDGTDTKKETSETGGPRQLLATNSNTTASFDSNSVPLVEALETNQTKVEEEKKENKTEASGSQEKKNEESKEVTKGSTSTSNSTETKIEAKIDLSPYTKCDKPEIKFGGGLQGRKANEYIYVPKNSDQFKHQGALNLKIVTHALCDQILHCIKNAINKDDDEKGSVKLCRDLSDKIGVKKADGSAADLWNKEWYSHRLQGRSNNQSYAVEMLSYHTNWLGFEI
ncbi:hypothetical protein CROQUDRAFT_106891 [Cronartium quercuum f. sp. fusiforme G11]|uniref:Uncharacterized protein n=1 Tax=Cronartium quercuum f. sp. fusiforme G11 TaxID=708437 RepID=A0A9P6TCJ7_9BASI|nr:hypothetical protein CROQUDRAFT_106891 [Cronartium quercuum f. sp. fusiforme G11]